MLFAQSETIRLYLKNKQVTDEQTDTWIEVPKELTAYERELALKVFKNSKIEISEVEGRRSAFVDLASLEVIPYEFLARIIKAWSESVPVTIENLKQVEAITLLNIWQYLRELYALG